MKDIESEMSTSSEESKSSKSEVRTSGGDFKDLPRSIKNLGETNSSKGESSNNYLRKQEETGFFRIRGIRVSLSKR